MRKIPFQPPGHPIAYFPSLSPYVGGSTAAILLCQLIYWTPRAKDPDGWIYKTQLELVAETGLTRDEQRSARKALKSRGLIAERYDRLAHQLYFQVNMDAYNAVIQGLYDGGEGEEDGPKPWKINEVRKTYMGKYGNRTSRYTEIASRHIRKVDSASTSSETPEKTTETQDGSLSLEGEEAEDKTARLPERCHLRNCHEWTGPYSTNYCQQHALSFAREAYRAGPSHPDYARACEILRQVGELLTTDIT